VLSCCTLAVPMMSDLLQYASYAAHDCASSSSVASPSFTSFRHLDHASFRELGAPPRDGRAFSHTFKNTADGSESDPKTTVVSLEELLFPFLFPFPFPLFGVQFRIPSKMVSGILPEMVSRILSKIPSEVPTVGCGNSNASASSTAL